MTLSADLLGHVPLFALLPEAERLLLLERINVVTAEAGKLLFQRGDPGDSMFVLKKGVVQIFFKNDTGDTIVLETARAGDFFGETSLLDGGPRSASARVLEDIEAFVVDRGDLDELFRLRPETALDMLTATGRRMRETTRLLRHSATRNINRIEEEKLTTAMRITDWISAFSGSVPFLMVHLVLFAAWILLNVEPLASTLWVGGFDRFPFGLLTMSVSLEAIILSVFVLLSQNRQAARDRIRNDIEYDVNLKAELEIAHVHELLENVEAKLLSRLDRIEKGLPPSPSAPSERSSRGA